MKRKWIPCPKCGKIYRKMSIVHLLCGSSKIKGSGCSRLRREEIDRKKMKKLQARFPTDTPEGAARNRRSVASWYQRNKEKKKAEQRERYKKKNQISN